MKVLLAVDGSTSSDRAASLVANLAWPMGSTIEVVTVYPGTTAIFDMPGVVLDAGVIQETEDAMEAEAKRIVIKVARRIAAPDLTVQTQVLRGRAATALLEQVAEFKADLVVVGNRGRGPFESAVLGSVSAEVVDHCPVPVLVARRDHIARILLGEDGSRSAAAAADTVRRWSALHGAPIRVLSVATWTHNGIRGCAVAEMRAAQAARTASMHEHQEALSRSTAAALAESRSRRRGRGRGRQPRASTCRGRRELGCRSHRRRQRTAMAASGPLSVASLGRFSITPRARPRRAGTAGVTRGLNSAVSNPAAAKKPVTQIRNSGTRPCAAAASRRRLNLAGHCRKRGNIGVDLLDDPLHRGGSPGAFERLRNQQGRYDHQDEPRRTSSPGGEPRPVPASSRRSASRSNREPSSCGALSERQSAVYLHGIDGGLGGPALATLPELCVRRGRCAPTACTAARAAVEDGETKPAR
jgi:nucleotide-binding universal stress UspA family protein